MNGICSAPPISFPSRCLDAHSSKIEMTGQKVIVVSKVMPVLYKIMDHKLNGLNYLHWSKTICLFLRSIDKHKHLVETTSMAS